MKVKISDRLDLRSILRQTDQTNRIVGLVLLLVIPLIALGIGLAISGVSGRIPTFILVIAGVSAFLGLWLFLQAMRSLQNPFRHAALNWPEIAPPHRVLEAIEQEWNSTPTEVKSRCGEHYLTPSWLLEMGDTAFNCYPLRYVAYAFFGETRNYVNGISTGTSRKVTIWLTCKDNLGGEEFILVDVPSEGAGLTFLLELKKRAPWAFYGHTDENHLGWLKNKSAFIAAVQQRYAQVQAGMPVEQLETQYASSSRAG